ncbi:MAG TPA: Stp1/IreP family PP2C-type Ser/Thr phosphatase [Acidimicrobiia bacterium]|nr:Stp1/IreP family PP2C-type Ser/Thr phosphatase [Acidimicrobiia bacterium]
MRYVWATATHKGMVRDKNEDSVYPTSSGESEDQVLVIVADGMGGHVAGEVASRIAVNAAASTDLEAVDRVAAGNRAIREEVARDPGLEGMGTTMTLLMVEDDLATFGHIGDSRAYLLRRGDLTQLTADHTVAAEYVAKGELSPEEASTHPQRHMLLRTLGLTRYVNVDEVEVELQPGDRILLCSDGLTEMVSNESIGETLAKGTPDEMVWELIEMANDAGGVDNITVAVVEALE